MSNASEIMKRIRKDHGSTIATVGGSDFVDVDRIPTGIFAVDLAMGGGFPVGKCAIVYGPESSNKTNLILMTIIQAQIKWPQKNIVFVDAENSLDLKWVSTMGVDTNRLIVLHPEYAEQAVDFVVEFIHAEDVSMIVLDSIAALISANEIESSAEKVAVGGASLIVGKLYRKVVVAYTKVKNAGVTPPAFIAINQIRMKIGVMFGSPETMPGGNPPKFASSMTLRVYGKNIMDKKLSPVMPAYKEVSCVLQKWKCPILAVNATYSMQMIEANGNKPGYVNDWNTVSAYMKELDYLTKSDKGGWLMGGVSYPTLEACKSALYGNPAALADMKSTMISELLSKGESITEAGSEAGLDAESTADD